MRKQHRMALQLSRETLAQLAPTDLRVKAGAVVTNVGCLTYPVNSCDYSCPPTGSPTCGL
jgi:hypothetical protein